MANMTLPSARTPTPVRAFSDALRRLKQVASLQDLGVKPLCINV
jgi:hypothetical protein